MDCALCGQKALKGIGDDSFTFCCFGCRTVWHLLSAKGALEGYESHPVYRQALKSGLISNPALKIEAKESISSQRLMLEIREMWCPSCAEVIEYLMRLERGVIHCRVDYATDLTSIEYDPCRVSEEDLFQLIKSLGYHPVALEGVLGKPISFSLYLRFFVAAFAALNVMMLAYPLYATYFNFEVEGWGMLLAWLSLALSAPVMLYSAWPIFQRFYHSLRTGLYGMESLVIIGTSSAWILSLLNMMKGSTEVYFDTLTVVIAFVLLGKILESKAKFTAKEAYYSLARSLPQRARRGGVFVALKEIQSGDLIEVVAGERIALEGEVYSGEALVNEASMTGESTPLLARAGYKVSAGTLVETGHLQICVQTGASSLDQLVSACQLNLENKSQYVRALDPIARIFVPLVLIAALGVFFWSGFENALSVILISCPCAIGIAAPLVEGRLIQTFAREGAIVRNRGVLGKLPDTTLFAFDKTGTLTQGDFIIQGLFELDEEEQSALKGLASLSHHPIARTLCRAITQEGKKYTQVFEREGAGIEGEGDYLGSRKFLLSKGIELEEQEDSFTEVFFYHKKKIFRFELIDGLRPAIKQTLQQLPKTLLLSGDRPLTVEKVALAAGIKAWRAELSPLGKKNVLETLQKEGEKVLFVGDGLNDAPALTQADIGIATANSLGLSQAASDILLTAPLNVLPRLYTLSKKGRRLIHQNLFWAFFYNLLGVPLAAVGALNPLFAALAMTVSSLIVILNSLRLGR